MKKILFSIIYTLLAFFTFSLNTKAISKEYTFSYTGDYQEFIAPFTGLYKLEVWGAEGGFGNSSSPGGKGGYSSGYYKLTVGDMLVAKELLELIQMAAIMVAVQPKLELQVNMLVLVAVQLIYVLLMGFGIIQIV